MILPILWKEIIKTAKAADMIGQIVSDCSAEVLQHITLTCILDVCFFYKLHCYCIFSCLKNFLQSDENKINALADAQNDVAPTHKHTYLLSELFCLSFPFF